METKVIILSVDGIRESIHVFSREEEYEKFTNDVLDGYDDDRCHSESLDWEDFPYKTREFQLAVAQAVVKEMGRR